MSQFLSAEDAARFAADGVVRVPGFLSAEDLAGIRAALDDYLRDDLPSQQPPDCTFETDGKTVRNLWRLEQHSDFFRKLADRPHMVAAVETLLGGPTELMAVETFNKPSRVGSAVPYHQDNAYFCQSPPDVVTVWIAIDAVTDENGPVRYVRGSHRQGMLATRASGVPGNSMGLAREPEIDPEQLFVCKLSPGDAAFHHCQTIHASDPNASAHPRLGLLLVYRGVHTQCDPELQRAYQGGGAAAESREQDANAD